MKVRVVKLGGAALTNKGKMETLNEEALSHICSWLKLQGMPKHLDNLLVEQKETEEAYGHIIIHGAGSFGHHQAVSYGLGKPIQVSGKKSSAARIPSCSFQRRGTGLPILTSPKR